MPTIRTLAVAGVGLGLLGVGALAAPAAPADRPAAPDQADPPAVLAATKPVAATAAATAPAAVAPGSESGVVIWRENFDQLADQLQPRVDESTIPAAELGFTHTPPDGWEVSNTGFSGGMTEWRGWSLTTLSFWTKAELQRRNWFTGAHGVIAVADSDEWADGVAPQGRMNTVLTSEPIAVAGHTDLELAFNSHYRPFGNQRASVVVSFDGAAPVTLAAYTDERLSMRESIEVAVPAGAQTARFSWQYTDSNDDWFWAIDEITLTVPLPDPPPADRHVVFDVASDIQSDNSDYVRVVTKLNAMQPQASAIILNGDIPDSGSEAQWAALDQLFADHPHASGRMLGVLGNHELGVGLPDGTRRFLAHMGRDTVWAEEVVDGIPLIAVASDRLLADLATFEAQMAWLDGRLEYWASRNVPVLVFSHYNLPQTVSGSYAPNYSQRFYERERFERSLGAYANVVLFTSHTHWDLGMDDWTARRFVPGGDPRGFAVFNTGAIINKYGPNGDTGESYVGCTSYVCQEASGLRVHVLADRIRVEAHDFFRDQVIQTLEIPISTPAAAPELQVQLDPAQPTGDGGWWTGPVTVDGAVSGGRPADLEASVNDADWASAPDLLTVEDDGEHSVRLRGEADFWTLPMQEATFKIDTTEPISSARLDEEARTVWLRAVDVTSGVARSEYRLDGSAQFQPYSGPIAVGADGATVYFRSVDRAGNVEHVSAITVPAVQPVAATVSASVAQGSASAPVLTATVAMEAGPVSGGTVTVSVVRSGRVVFEQTVPVEDGTVTLPLPLDRPGTHRATVEYSGTSGVAAASDTVSFSVRLR